MSGRVWRMSSLSIGDNQRLEVSRCTDGIAVRNSQRPDEVVHFTASEWAAFIGGIKNGEFDYLAVKAPVTPIRSRRRGYW